MRAFAQTKSEIDRAKRQEDITPSPMVDLVMEIAADVFAEDRGLGKYRKAKS